MDYEKLSEIDISKIRDLHNDYRRYIIEILGQNDKNISYEVPKCHRKIRKMIADMDKTDREKFFYECGIFIGIYKILEEINMLYIERNEIEETYKKYSKCKYVSEILDYLYINPNSSLKEILKNIGANNNYLYRILKQLKDEGLIHRYGKHNNIRYILTRSGRNFIKIKKD